MSETTAYMLTTVDNPFNPFTQFRAWFLFDVEKGYNSCSYLARIAKLSDQLTEEENNIEVSRAIDEIIKYDLTNRYRKVSESSFENIKKETEIPTSGG